MRSVTWKLLLFGLIVVVPDALIAAPGSVLYTFQGGADGQNPTGALTVDAAGNVYGKAYNTTQCFPLYCELVFELSPNGGAWSYQVLYTFLQPTFGTGGLVVGADGNVYGTTSQGGMNGRGTVFELTHSANGWTETTLYSFGATQTDGTAPGCTMVFDEEGNLYGTTETGGLYGAGTVFELLRSGSNWTEEILYNFSDMPDGAWPLGPLTFDSQGNLYGTTNGGGIRTTDCIINRFDGCGTVFELARVDDVWTENQLYAFQGSPTDGQWPSTGVIFDTSGNLFGTTVNGGCGKVYCGIAFELSPKQGGLWDERVIERFTGTNGALPANLAFSPSGNLFGSTIEGGSGSGANGLVFQLRPKIPSKRERILYEFSGGEDGSEPDGIAFDSSGYLFGTTAYGGNASGLSGNGVIFVGKP